MILFTEVRGSIKSEVTKRAVTKTQIHTAVDRLNARVVLDRLVPVSYGCKFIQLNVTTGSAVIRFV